MGINSCFFLATWSCLVAISPVNAQSGEAEREIAHLLEQFFFALQDKDVLALKGAFHPEASLNTVRNSENGNYSTLENLSVDDFLDRISNFQGFPEEKITSIDVRIDGHMATAWAPYDFFVDGDFHHCGVNAFQFIHGREGWKITHVMDTRRVEGCE
jgi:hypothetical protein